MVDKGIFDSCSRKPNSNVNFHHHAHSNDDLQNHQRHSQSQIISINTPLCFESAQNHTDSGETVRCADAQSIISSKIKILKVVYV